ncbi:MAG: ABC transporter substrate-binding protein [Oligoflexales bacterium]
MAFLARLFVCLSWVSIPAFAAMAVVTPELVYRHVEDGAPGSVDPINIKNTYANSLVTAIHDTLFEYKYLKQPYELKPSLAESMPTVSRDGLVYTIKIRPGVRFADDPAFKDGKGREVVAEDFIYSIKRHFIKSNRSNGKWLWQGKIKGLDKWGNEAQDMQKAVEGLKVVDRHTVQIILVKPFPQFPYTLALGYAAIIPWEAVEKYGKQLSVHPVGSGPFILESLTSTKAVLRKNPTYRKEIFDLQAHGFELSKHGSTGIEALGGRNLPLVDKVEVSFIKQPSSLWNSLTKGNEIQYGWVPSLQLNHVLASKSPLKLKKEFAEKFHMRVASDFGYVYLEFNMNDPSIGYHDDPKRNSRNHALRCAIRKGFDWQNRIDRMYHGIGEAFPGIIPPGVDGFDPALSRESVELDPDGAKQLLASNTWNVQTLPILYYSGVNSVDFRKFFVQFRSWMMKIGYPKEKVKLKTFATFGDYSKAIKNGLLMTHSMGWGLDYPDAENVLQLYYGPNKSPGSNSSNFDNKEYNKIYRNASVMQPSPQRTNLYRKANKILIDECVVIAGFSRTRVHLWHKNVSMYPTREVLGNYFKYVGIKAQ